MAALLAAALLAPAMADPKPPPTKKARRAERWYAATEASYVANTVPLGAARRGIAFSGEIPLRSDRELMGVRFVTPTGGDASDGITSNTFRLDRGGAASASLLFGVAVPTSGTASVAVEGVTYLRGGVPTIARSWGATLPYGHFVDSSRARGYGMPSLQPDLYHAQYADEWKDLAYRVTLGDFHPVVWAPQSGPRERNLLDLSCLTFRPFLNNITQSNVGSPFPPDRIDPGNRLAVRGADVWIKAGEVEAEMLRARAETHPSSPSETFAYREAVGGRAGLARKKWGLGFSAFHMYGDNFTAAPTAATLPPRIPAGSETLWSVDGSACVAGGLHAYGFVGSTDFRRTQVFSRKNRAWVVGLLQKDFMTRGGEWRLQYQAVDPNYEPLGVHLRTQYPENYAAFSSGLRLPFRPGGSLLFSLRAFSQLQPDIAPGPGFAGTDPFFQADARNRGQGSVLDWLAATDFQVGRLPLRVYLSWEEIAFRRGGTPGLAFSATHRSVTQRMAVLRYNPLPELAVDVGAILYGSGGTVGSFARDVQFAESQTVPRLGLTWTPDREHLVRLLLRGYHFRDHLAASRGLNDFDAAQCVLEVHARLGDP